jgi:hypothetical protein
MSASLEYSIYMTKSNGNDRRFLAAFNTTRISSSPSAVLPSPVDNEVEVGSLFTAIRTRRLLSCVIPGASGANSYAIHSLFATPLHQPILYLGLTLNRRIRRKEVKVDAVVDPNSAIPTAFKPRDVNLVCEQVIVSLGLTQVELVQVRATDEGTYTADFKVSGGTETEYQPESDCDKFFEL